MSPQPTTPPFFTSTLQAIPTPLTPQSPTTNTNYYNQPTTATPANEHLQAQMAHTMNHLTPYEEANILPAAAVMELCNDEQRQQQQQ
jgi:hypothetical protein